MPGFLCCFGGAAGPAQQDAAAVPAAKAATYAAPGASAAPTASGNSVRQTASSAKTQATGVVQTAPVPPVVLHLQRQLAALQGTWISRVDMALKLTMECTGATAVGLTMLSATHDCLVVLARRGPQHLVLPPGSCIAITDPGEMAQSLDTPEQHSLQHMYSTSAALVRAVPPARGAAGVNGAAGPPPPGSSAGAAPALPLDWAHLHRSHGITHFAALPLYHGSNLAGALTILGTTSTPAAAAAGGGGGPGSTVDVHACNTALPQLISAPNSGPVAGLPAHIVAANASVGSALSAAANAANGAGVAGGAASLDALFRAPLSLELVGMAVAQCCLGADMALACHAVEMVQAMHACASIQQLVAGISLGLQALMHARFCLTLRCNVALAVEFQPNAIMFEEAGAVAGGAASVSGSTAVTGQHHYTASTHDGGPKPQVTGRASAVFGSPAAGGGGGTGLGGIRHMTSGGLPNGDGRAAFSTARSGLDTTGGDAAWGASSGHVTASVLLHQIVGRRYKARPFSVYHTLLIRTIHELAASAYGGTVITQCHDHMQDAKTPSRDIYALGRGVGQPPQSMVLSVTHLRPADDANPAEVAAAAAAAAAAVHTTGSSGTNGGAPHTQRSGFTRRSTLGAGGGVAGAAASSTDTGSHAHPPASPEAHPSSASGPASTSAHAVLSAVAADSPAPPEPRTYIGLYLTSAEPLPAALLELILVEAHSLACHVLSPLVHRKLLVGELAVEWGLMQIVTSSNLPHGGNTDSASAHARPLNRQNTASNAPVPAAPAAAAAAAAAGGGPPASAGGSTLGGSLLTGGSVAAVTPEQAGDAAGVTGGAGGAATGPLPAAGASRLGGSLGPSAPNSRLSSLQRIMAPFLMADMAATGDAAMLGATTVGSGQGGLPGPPPMGIGAAGRRSSDMSLVAGNAGGAGAGGGSVHAGTANMAGGGAGEALRSLGTGPSTGGPPPAGATALGIRRILAFDAQAGAAGGGGGGGGGAGTAKPASGQNGRKSVTISESVAREMMMAAAAASNGGGLAGTAPGGDKFLSTEVATVQDTHSQMGLLVTSYKETLHNMHMELSVGSSNRNPAAEFADDPGKLVLREVLGKGGHGVVFRGSMHTLEVAIKVFQTPGEDEPLAAGTASRPEVLAETLLQRRRVLTRAALELAIMSSISHPNIIQVYAQWPTALLERDETQPCRRRLRKLPPDTPPPASGGLVCAVMVMEYCDKGTLVDAINRGDFVTPARDGSGYKPNYKAIYTTLLEVALALRHLASMAVTHCDVKPANILLRSCPRDPRGFTAKLADFGYAALLRDSGPDGHRSVVTDEACGTVTHMAPESFVEGEPVDSSADVYAFGILMWELISGKQPYHDRNLKQLPHEVVNKGLRPTFPPNTPDVYKSLAKSCWSPLPRNRPTAAQVVQSIQAQLDKIEAVARLLGKV